MKARRFRPTLGALDPRVLPSGVLPAAETTTTEPTPPTSYPAISVAEYVEPGNFYD